MEVCVRQRPTLTSTPVMGYCLIVVNQPEKYYETHSNSEIIDMQQWKFFFGGRPIQVGWVSSQPLKFFVQSLMIVLHAKFSSPSYKHWTIQISGTKNLGVLGAHPLKAGVGLTHENLTLGLTHYCVLWLFDNVTHCQIV